jgi:hypothetical protein
MHQPCLSNCRCVVIIAFLALFLALCHRPCSDMLTPLAAHGHVLRRDATRLQPAAQELLSAVQRRAPAEATGAAPILDVRGRSAQCDSTRATTARAIRLLLQSASNRPASSGKMICVAIRTYRQPPSALQHWPSSNFAKLNELLRAIHTCCGCAESLGSPSVGARRVEVAHAAGPRCVQHRPRVLPVTSRMDVVARCLV